MSACGCLPGTPENGWHEERSEECQRKESAAFARAIEDGLVWAREHLNPRSADSSSGGVS